jgi:hypothetical protein
MSLVGARASSLPMQLGGLLVPGARWTSAVYCCGLLIGGVASWRQQSVRYAVHPSHGFYWPELLASRLQQLCRLSVATVWWVGVGCLILSSVQQVSPSGCLLHLQVYGHLIWTRLSWCVCDGCVLFCGRLFATSTAQAGQASRQ